MSGNNRQCGQFGSIEASAPSGLGSKQPNGPTQDCRYRSVGPLCTQRFQTNAVRVLMPRYFFDWHDGPATTRDRDGIVFPDLETAKVEAACGLADMVKDDPPTDERRELGITIRGEDQMPLFTTSMVFEAKLLRRASN